MSGFDICLPELLKVEGGFVNNSRDPGGVTNLGVTERTWAAWVKRDVTEAEMRALSPMDVAPLYRANYWNPVHGDSLPTALAMCVFDFAVNSSPRRAAKYLQTMVGANNDGAIGPATLALTDAYVRDHGVAEAVRSYQALRRQFYHQCDGFSTFGRGWLNRVDGVETAALRLA